MTWILDEAEVLLRSDGYSTTRYPNTNAVLFENETVFGFVLEYSSPTELLASWQRDQSALLERFASVLRSVSAKAWNVYSVFLTEEQSADPGDIFQFEAIEENLRHTRKIPRQAIRVQADVKVALAPILSIAGQSSLAPESFDERLRARLVGEIGEDSTRIFLSDADEDTVARTFGEKNQ